MVSLAWEKKEKLICGHAPSKSKLNPQRGIVGGNCGVQGWGGEGGGPLDTWPHSQTRGRCNHYHKLAEMNDNPSHPRLAVLTQQSFFISRTACERIYKDDCAIAQPYSFTNVAPETKCVSIENCMNEQHRQIDTETKLPLSSTYITRD